jgi:hypothetical protein
VPQLITCNHHYDPQITVINKGPLLPEVVRVAQRAHSGWEDHGLFAKIWPATPILKRVDREA